MSSAAHRCSILNCPTHRKQGESDEGQQQRLGLRQTGGRQRHSRWACSMPLPDTQSCVTRLFVAGQEEPVASKSSRLPNLRQAITDCC